MPEFHSSFSLCVQPCTSLCLFVVFFSFSFRHQEGKNKEKVSHVQTVQLGKQEGGMMLRKTHRCVSLMFLPLTVSVLSLWFIVWHRYRACVRTAQAGECVRVYARALSSFSMLLKKCPSLCRLHQSRSDITPGCQCNAHTRTLTQAHTNRWCLRVNDSPVVMWWSSVLWLFSSNLLPVLISTLSPTTHTHTHTHTQTHWLLPYIFLLVQLIETLVKYCNTDANGTSNRGQTAVFCSCFSSDYKPEFKARCLALLLTTFVYFLCRINTAVRHFSWTVTILPRPLLFDSIFLQWIFLFHVKGIFHINGSHAKVLTQLSGTKTFF